MKLFRKIVAIGGISLASIAGVAVAPVALETVSAATGCTGGHGEYSDFYMTDGVLRPYTFTVTCDTQAATGGYKIRYKVFCSFGSYVWTGYVQLAGQSKSASCGPGLGYITSQTPQFVPV